VTQSRPARRRLDAAMLRRILPQLAPALVNGEVERLSSTEFAGRAFALGRWQQWPAEQSTAIREFLDAWWYVTLTNPDTEVPAHAVLAMLVEASGALDRWLGAWRQRTVRWNANPCGCVRRTSQTMHLDRG